MQDFNFIQEITKIFSYIATRIEEKDASGNIDIDLKGELVNITTENGVFVINRQLSLKEIWLSSPVSGPHHFAYNGNCWISKTGEELFAVLSRDLRIEIEQP